MSKKTFYTPKRDIQVTLHPFGIGDQLGEVTHVGPGTVFMVDESEPGKLYDDDDFVVEADVRDLVRVHPRRIQKKGGRHYVKPQ